MTRIVNVPHRTRAGSYSVFERRYNPIVTSDGDATIYRDFDDPMVRLVDERQVWTIVSGDNAGMYLVPGFAFVNREYYVITENRWSEVEQMNPGYVY